MTFLGLTQILYVCYIFLFFFQERGKVHAIYWKTSRPTTAELTTAAHLLLPPL